MKLAILLHLYQPVTQSEKTFKDIAESSYLPLIKLLKNRKNFKLTLNIPLSLLEQMDKYGYHQWLKDVKELTDGEYIELVGSGAYHPLLTKLPREIVQNQIILNEYGLGYYLGRRTGFEGEQAIMIRDLSGFFAPELAVDETLHQILEQLDYSWMLVDSAAVGGNTGAYKLNDSSCHLIARDTNLSNFFAFSRGLALNESLSYLSLSSDTVVALDGETFGHHNKDGIHFLGKVIERLLDNDIEFVTVSEFLEDAIAESAIKKIDSFKETTWSYLEGTNAYHLWEGNKMQDILWEIYNKIVTEFDPTKIKDSHADMENIAFWKKEDVPEDIKYELAFNQLLSSDPFWWLSGEQVGESVLYNRPMVQAFIDRFAAFAEEFENKELKDFIEKKAQELYKEMTNYETNNAPTSVSAS